MKSNRIIIMVAALAVISLVWGCGKDNKPPKPKPEDTNIDGYWKGDLFTSYLDSAVAILHGGNIRIYISYQKAVDTNTMKPTWSGNYTLKGDSIFYTMAPDVYGNVQKGKGLYELPEGQIPGFMQINYYYDNADGTGLYTFYKQ